MWKASGLFADTSLSRGASKNWALSMKRSCPREKDMVLLGVVGDAAHPPLHLGYRLHQQVAVVPPQVVEHNWYGCGFGAEPQFEVASVVGGPSVPTGDVAVVLYRVSFQESVTHMASARSPVALPVCSCHFHGLRFRQHFLDPTLFHLECSAALGPRYSAGASVFPSHRTTT